MNAVLIVDDNQDTRENIAELMEGHGYECFTAGDGLAAIELVRKLQPECLILDMKIPKLSGMEVLKELQAEMEAGLIVINITAYGEISKAVTAIKLGAYDFLEKPFNNDALLLSINRGLQAKRMKEELNNLRRIWGKLPEAEKIFGDSPAIQKLIRQVEIVAPTNMTVLIQGETGSGKEIVANYLHGRSLRRREPFIAVDCGAIPVNLIESELFGHHRGAFTDAKDKRTGQFEMAHGGTLFLDEIGNLPDTHQRKLLRAVEQKKILPVGAEKEISIDVRLVAASNDDLRELVRQRKFREDLFYRLSEFTVSIPPLRERIKDIAYLAGCFLEEANTDANRTITGISNAALQKLQTYTWPGNVRELRNVIRKATLLARKEIQPEHIIFPSTVPLDAFLQSLIHFPSDKKTTLKEKYEAVSTSLEKKMIEWALSCADGNISHASEIYGVTRKTFYYRMSVHGISTNAKD